MRDSEVVASIVAGDSLGLAAAYDRYADPLYKYCRTLLNDPADAADAVQDTFVIAASRLGGLRDPGRLRPWLYAVARNEAVRILRSKKGASTLDEAPDVTDDSADAAAAERADLRALLEDAAAGLNPGEREVVELQLRQGLETAEVATVLGVSRNHAHALLSRAREQLETCLAVLLVGRAGRGECDELGAMLAGWDGRLTILLRKRVHRHIEQCPTCGARRAHELRPAMLLDLSPGAALAAGAAISLRLAQGAPDGLRAHTLALATGQEVGAVAHRAAVLSRAGAFDHSGFPKPAHGATAGLAAHGGPGGGASGAGGGSGGITGALRSSPRRAATVTAAVVIAAIIAAIAFALTGNSGTARPAADPSPQGAAAPAGAAAASAAVTSAAASGAASATGKTEPSATSAATSAAAATSPTTTTTTAAPGTARPTTAGPSTTPATASPDPTLRPTPGTLSESPQGGPLLLPLNGAGRQIDLSGSGSGDWRVTWSLAVANDPKHIVSVSAASGTLTSADSTIAVTVTTSRFLPCGARRSPTITVSPGGAVFTVCTGMRRSFSGGDSARSATAP